MDLDSSSKQRDPRVRMLWWIGAFVAVAWLLSIAGLVRKQVQVVEWDGNRSREFKAFGLIPWGQDHENVPGLTISNEAASQIGKAVKSPPGLDLAKGKPMKIIRGSQVEYCSRFDWDGDANALRAAYAKQLKNSRAFDSPDGGFTLDGVAEDGSQVMVAVSAFYKVAGGPAAGHDLLIKVT